MPIQLTLKEADLAVQMFHRGIESLDALVDCHTDPFTGRIMVGHGTYMRQIESQIRRAKKLRQAIFDRTQAARKKE